MSDTEHEQTPGTGSEAPPSVDPIAPPDPSDETPDVNPETAAAVGYPKGNAKDASQDPNLGHAFEDQAQGVGTGPSQTSAENEESSDDDGNGGQ